MKRRLQRFCCYLKAKPKKPMTRFVTRKDVARALEVSVNTVIRNEQRLGLDRARCDPGGRMVRYDAGVAEEELRKRRAILGENSFF